MTQGRFFEAEHAAHHVEPARGVERLQISVFALAQDLNSFRTEKFEVTGERQTGAVHFADADDAVLAGLSRDPRQLEVVCAGFEKLLGG